MTEEINTLPPRQFQVRIKRDYYERSRDESFQPTTLQEMHAAHVARRARWARLAVEFELTKHKPKQKPKPAAPPPPPPPPIPEPQPTAWSGPPRIRDIQRAVAAHFELPLGQMLSHQRYRKLIGPRQVAMYLSRIMTHHSMPEIGRRFDGRDHTTIMHGVRRAQVKISVDNDLQEAVESLKNGLSAAP